MRTKESEAKHGGAEAALEVGVFTPGMLSSGVPAAPFLEQKEAVEVEEKDEVEQEVVTPRRPGLRRLSNK